MTTGYISTKASTTFFTAAPPSSWTTGNVIKNYAGSNQYMYLWNYEITINGVLYTKTSALLEYGPTYATSYTPPSGGAFAVGDTIYNGGTAYTIKTAKQVTISSSGANGEIKRKSGGNYYSLPYVALFASDSVLTMTLKAFPATHFTWDPNTSKWNHDNDTNQEREITVAESFAALIDKSYSATYTQYEWSITTQPNNAFGTIYVGLSGTSTLAWFANNQFATLRASVNLNDRGTYKFKRFTLNGVEVGTGYKDYSTVNGVSVPYSGEIQIETSQANRVYVAEFVLISYTLNVTPQNPAQGSVTVKIGGVPSLVTTGISVAGTRGVEVITVPTFGYYLTSWHNGSSDVSTSLSYPFNMPEANLSLEARYAILPSALLVVTKKKGNGAGDPEDMGSVALYHTVDNYLTTSPVGDLTLQASMFTTKQYRLDPAPASALYQFDGWFKTVDGSDVEITDDSIFDVDGTSLYINVLDETQINVIARFSERTLCTIAPVSSDSSVYEANNAAEMAGCACAVTTLPPDNDVDSDGAHDSGDQWLSGQTITVEARQASGWELRSWIVQRLEDGLDPVTVYSKSKGDAGFGQRFSFPLLTDVQVIAVSAYTLPADQMQIQALLKSGQPLTSGTVEIHPCGDNYVEMENGSTANVDDGAVCELTAIPANGYKFVGWRVATEGSEIISTLPTYSFTVTASAVYYAEFEATGFDSLVLFESGSANKTLNWAGKTYLAPIPTCMSSARVYADAYPVLVSIGMSDNPSHPANVENVITSTAPSQNPFRLPMRRPRKSFSVQFTATDTVSEVCVATSMEDLKNG
jgi:hypothetical protein